MENKIICKSGLMYNEFDFQGNSLNGDYSINVGIEETLNCFDVENIMSAILGHPYQSKSYNSISKLITEFMQHDEINIAIKKAQFTDNSDWINILGKENAEKIIKYFDIIIESLSFFLTFDSEFTEITDKSIKGGKTLDEIQNIKLSKIIEELDKIEETYKNVYNSIGKILKNYTNKKIK